MAEWICMVCYSCALVIVGFACRGEEQRVPAEAADPDPRAGTQCRSVQGLCSSAKKPPQALHLRVHSSCSCHWRVLFLLLSCPWNTGGLERSGLQNIQLSCYE